MAREDLLDGEVICGEDRTFSREEDFAYLGKLCLARLRLRPTRHVDIVAPIGG